MAERVKAPTRDCPYCAAAAADTFRLSADPRSQKFNQFRCRKCGEWFDLQTRYEAYFGHSHASRLASQRRPAH